MFLFKKPKVVGIFGRRFEDVDTGGKEEIVEYIKVVSAQYGGSIILLTRIPNDGVAKLTLEVFASGLNSFVCMVHAHHPTRSERRWASQSNQSGVTSTWAPAAACCRHGNSMLWAGTMGYGETA